MHAPWEALGYLAVHRFACFSVNVLSAQNVLLPNLKRIL